MSETLRAERTVFLPLEAETPRRYVLQVHQVVQLPKIPYVFHLQCFDEGGTYQSLYLSDTRHIFVPLPASGRASGVWRDGKRYRTIEEALDAGLEVLDQDFGPLYPTSQKTTIKIEDRVFLIESFRRFGRSKKYAVQALLLRDTDDRRRMPRRVGGLVQRVFSSHDEAHAFAHEYVRQWYERNIRSKSAP